MAFLSPSSFELGVNYWASHAGTAMWRDWQPATILADLRKLSEYGLKLLRVFPLWSDFQPVQLLTGGGGYAVEYRFGEAPFPDTPAGQAGLDEGMLERFRQVADMADSLGMRLIVPLINGWMSGRLFLPAAFNNRNPISDPLLIQWQVRFARCFVTFFKHHPAIVAWELGNECNVMGQNPTTEQAWIWQATLSNAIRAADPDRPVLSGMHSLRAEKGQPWNIRDQAELSDFLTVHPYPIFTPFMQLDPANSLRPILHAAAEARFYADIGGKPCFAEEMGTTGPYVLADSLAGNFARASLFSLWAHDCRAALWWCATDLGHIPNAPYDWNAVEHELGLMDRERKPKPVLSAFSAFQQFLNTLDFQLPPHTREAVCILTQGQDPWGVAHAAFLLGKQAGLDLTFRMADQPLPESSLYLLPSVRGLSSIHQRNWQELLERVKAGATLYISLDDAILGGLNEVAGVEFLTRFKMNRPLRFRMEVVENGREEEISLTAIGQTRYSLRLTSATCLAQDTEGNPVFTRARFGKGEVVLLTFPLEWELATSSGFHEQNSPYHLYRVFARQACSSRICKKTSRLTGVTEHPISPGRRVIILINYSPDFIPNPFILADGWNVDKIYYGDPAGLFPFDALVFQASAPHAGS